MIPGGIVFYVTFKDDPNYTFPPLTFEEAIEFADDFYSESGGYTIQDGKGQIVIARGALSDILEVMV